MTRDAEGLPDNLSPLDPHMTCWGEGATLHLAIFTHEVWAKVQPHEDVRDYLDEASYILSLPIWGWQRVLEAIMNVENRMIAAGEPLVADIMAPTPFPPDARHQLWAKAHGRSVESMEGGGLVSTGPNGDDFAAPFHGNKEKVDVESSPILREVRDFLKGSDDDSVHG